MQLRQLVSLLVAVTGAKAGFVVHKNQFDTHMPDPHGYAVMRNAMEYVDPVVCHGPAANLYLRGEFRREAATGLCEKFYSEHGALWGDRYGEEEDQPAFDAMRVTEYPCYSLPVNGWYKDPHVGDRWELFMKSNDLAIEHGRQQEKRWERQHACERKRSLLHQVVTVDDLDPAPKDQSDMPKADTALTTGQVAKKAYSNWTIDLNKCLDPCANWADEVEDEDDARLPVRVAGSLNESAAAVVQSAAIGEPEGDMEVGSAPTSAPVSDLAALPEPSPESTSVDDESLVDEAENTVELPSSASVLQPDPVHDSVTPSHTDTDLLGPAVEGLTKEELEEEDMQIYGDAPVASQELKEILRRLHESVLISRNDEAGSSSESSVEEDQYQQRPAIGTEAPASASGGEAQVREVGQEVSEEGT